VGIEYFDNMIISHKLCALFAGPFSNLVLVIIGIVLKNQIITAINIFLAVFNMLPVKGLDGGSILEAFLLCFLSAEKVDKTLNLVTVLFGFLSFLLFIFLLIIKIINYSVLLFGIYLITPIIIKKFVER
jgi:Zn-dependent protease